MAPVKRALVLGTLAGQVDAIQALRARGIETFACGHERKGPGVDEADGFHLVDITDIEAVRNLAEQLSVDLVYSVGSDIAMPAVVSVSESLSLPHFHGSRLTRVLRRKEELRSVLAEAGLSPVRFEHVATSADHAWDLFPCIVKPVDSQGQRGSRSSTPRPTCPRRWTSRERPRPRETRSSRNTLRGQRCRRT